MQTVIDEETLYCVNHPQTETALRCSKCLDPICTLCMVRTPVGLRCPKCTGAQQSRDGRYYVPSLLTQVSTPTVFKAGLAALLVAILGGIAWGQFRFVGDFNDWSFWYALLISIVGASVVAHVANERRGPVLQTIAASTVLIAAIIAVVWSIVMVNHAKWSEIGEYLSNPLLRAWVGLTLPNLIFVAIGMILAWYRLKE